MGVEDGERLATPPAGEVGGDPVGRHVDGVHRLPAGPRAGEAAHEVGVGLGQRRVEPVGQGVEPVEVLGGRALRHEDAFRQGFLSAGA